VHDFPLARWAQGRLDALAGLSGAVFPDAASLLGERAAIHGFRSREYLSCHGGCRFYRTGDGWVALNLAREADREMLPALFGVEGAVDPVTEFASMTEQEAVARGRLLGMAIAGLSERAASPATRILAAGGTRVASRRPRVLDLSALWAGPLASRLLRIAGADVIRVESAGREDPLEASDPAHFAVLAEGKSKIRLDLRSPAGRDELLSLIDECDIVIEAARPRALRQMGIDADAVVAARKGLIWVTITGHGIDGDAGEWVGFGDDAGVAGGLSRALYDASGLVGFVGDAIGDPLTGLYAAETALRHFCGGTGARLVLSMSGIVAQAVAETPDVAGEMRDWAARMGRTIMAETASC
jgi:hypothetical protein